MLIEGHGLKLPAQCRVMQTWSFEIESDGAFIPDTESVTDDGSRNFSNVPAGRYDLCTRTRRFCALNFLVTEATDAEQKYKVHLNDTVENVEELDMRVQFTGRILRIEEKLGVHSKTPVVEKTKGKKGKKKRNTFLSLAAHAAQASEVTPPAPVPVPEPPTPAPTVFALLSFPSAEEHDKFLARASFGDEDNNVREEIILAKHLYLPPKSKPISSNDWSYGNPHEPYGQDYFG
jgi:hypothetical protein